MLIKLKVKKSDWKQEVESFGNNMYLAYVISQSDSSILQELTHLLSKKLGVPPSKIKLVSRNGGDMVFDLM
jgi:hypothetical protein